jgi:hypothetical protein
MVVSVAPSVEGLIRTSLQRIYRLFTDSRRPAHAPAQRLPALVVGCLNLNGSARMRTAPCQAQRENNLLLAEQRGVGPASLTRVDVRGLQIEGARHPYL